jgi:hypothetical protein
MVAGGQPCLRRIPMVYLSAAVICAYMGVFILLEEN